MDRQKNPDRVRGGQVAARLRWGTPGPAPEKISLAGLTDDRREMVVALVKILREQSTGTARDD
jgi:hypothetical protein